MKIIMLSNDPKVLDVSSAAHARMLEYGDLFEELHIVVLTRKQFMARKIRNVSFCATNSKYKFFSIWDGYGVCGRLLKEKYDFIVTAQDAFTTLLVLLLRMRFRFVFQLQIHTDFASPYFWRESFKNIIYYLTYKIALHCADCFRVVSKRTFNSLAELGIRNYELKTSVLSIFVDIEEIETNPRTFDLHQKYPQFDFIVLIVSRLTMEKNITLALKVFKKVVTKYPRIGLCIIGEGPEREALEREVARHTLKNNVVFEGWVSGGTLVSYYKTADLFLLTSNYEGYGLALVEAGASKCPIITTNVGLVGDVLTPSNDALVCEPRDADCLFRHIIKLIKDKSLREKLERNGFLAVQKIKISKEEYLKQYKESFLLCRK